MGNTLQNNPSNAAEDLVQPDWNSAKGIGVPGGDEPDEKVFNDIYGEAKQGAADDEALRQAEIAQSKLPRKPADVDTHDE